MFNQSYGVHIMPHHAISLGVDTHVHVSTDTDKIILRNQALHLVHAWFKSHWYVQSNHICSRLTVYAKTAMQRIPGVGHLIKLQQYFKFGYIFLPNKLVNVNIQKVHGDIQINVLLHISNFTKGLYDISRCDWLLGSIKLLHIP